jgi:thiol:disulfide interchange protein DsbA
MKSVFTVFAAVAAALLISASAHGATWTEGVNYFLVAPARPTSLPAGKVEVTEVFSYACPACNIFQPTMHKLKQSLPANAVLDYLPAAFNTVEDWPMFQLAYCTAQVLGIDQQTHDAMFDAVWKGGDLSIIDPSTKGLKSRMPTIEDAAKFYSQHAGGGPESPHRPRPGDGVSRRPHAHHHRQRQVSAVRRVGRRQR